METDLRQSGIKSVGDIRWGTHFCQFFETKQDLADVLVPYVEAGLNNNEFCIWVIAQPLTQDDALSLLSKKIPDTNGLIEKGQLEVVPYDQWYTKDGAFDQQQVLAGWVEKMEGALDRGFDGLRATGDTSWLEKTDWRAFNEYEETMNNVIGAMRMVALCSYYIDHCCAADVIDVLAAHQFALARKGGKWMRLESEESRLQREAFSAAGNVIINLSRDHSITEFNPQAEELYGFSYEEMKGRDYFESCLPEEIRGGLAAEIETVLSEQRIVSFENPVKTKSGERILQWTISPTKGLDGEINGIIKVGQDITERKVAETALIQSEQRLKTIMEAVPFGVVISTPDRRVLDANNHMLKIFGYSESEKEKFCQIPATEYYFDQRDRQRLLELASQDKAKNFEARFKRRDGSTFWGSADVILTETPSGEQMLISAFQDVTARKIEQEKIRQTRDFLERLIAYANASIIVWDEKKVITLCNHAFERLTGFDAISVEGKNLQFLFPESSRQQSMKEIMKASSGEFWESVEIPIMRSDGEVRIALWNSANVYREDGSLQATIAQGQDITERKRAEAALASSEASLKLSQRIAILGSWELDLKTNTLAWSDEVYCIFGLKPQEFTATHEAFLEAVHPDDRGAVDAAYSESIVQGKNSYEIEHRIVRKDTGEIRDVYEKCDHFRDKQGNILRSLGVVYDITQRKKIEDEIKEYSRNLEESNKELQSFNYSVSHDLRAPLRAIDGFSNILLEDYRVQLDDEGQRVIDIIRSNTKRMGNLIDDLLALSRLGRQQLKKSEINMNNLLVELQADLKDSLFPDRNISFHIADLPDSYGDLTQIRQVWSNLLANAIKFTRPREQAEITINAVPGKERNVYCVADNGVGFDMEYYDKLFGLFQRLHGEEEFEGTGVGLAIVKRIILRHGGDAWGKGEVDKGAELYFSLPNRERE